MPFLAAATLSQTGMSFVQQGIVVMGVFFAAAYHLTLAEMGLVTTALSLGVMISMVMMGALVDRVGPPRLLFVGTVAMSGLCLSLMAASGFLVLLVLLFFLGAALAITPATGTKAVFTAFHDRPRGMVMGIRQTGVPLGALLAASLLPRLAEHVGGMKPLFVLFAIELVLVGWLFSALIRRAAGQEAKARSTRFAWRIIGSVWRPALISALLVSGQYLVLGFTLSDLNRVHHLTLAWAGVILAVAQLGGGVSRVLAGLISDKIGGRRAPVVVGCALTAAAMALVVALLPTEVSFWLLAPIWFVFGMGAVGWNALTIAWAGESVPPERSGFAMSSVGTAAFLGSAVYPPLFGALVDATHHFALGWMLLSLLLVSTALLAWRFGRSPSPH